MIISLIAAVSSNGVIGRNNDLPWKLPDDMKYFMETTRNHAVIMGRKNFDSLPPKFKPLKDRYNIVMTRKAELLAGHDVAVVSSMQEAIEKAKEANLNEEIFVIGGAQIYDLALPVANRLYLTEIRAVIEGDTYFPKFQAAEWTEISRRKHDADDRHVYAFDFVMYERKN